MEIERAEMHRRAVPRVPGKSIDVEAGVKFMHKPVARHLCHDRCGGDAEAKLVAVNQSNLGHGVLHQKSIAKQRIGLDWKSEHRSLERDAVRWADAKLVDLVCIDHADTYCDRRL